MDLNPEIWRKFRDSLLALPRCGFGSTKSLSRVIEELQTEPDEITFLASLDAFKLSSMELWFLSLYFRFYGKIEHYFLVRDFFSTKVLSMSLSRWSAEVHLRLALECFDMQFDRVKKFSLGRKPSRPVTAFTKSLLLKSANPIREFYNASGLKCAGDVVFENFVRDARVAVLGPLTEYSNFDCFDEFDVVVVMNGSCGQGLESLGGKPLISYYGGALYSEAEKIRKVSHCLTYSVVFSEELRRYHANTIGSDLPVRVSRQVLGIMFRNDYGANMLQNVIFDLFSFCPETITIFGATLFCSSKIYVPTYEASFSDSDVSTDRLTVIRMHDPFTNFVFLKNLFDHKLLMADRLTSEVLLFTKSSYARRLDELYFQ